MTRFFLRNQVRNLLHRHHRTKMNNLIAILCLLFMLVESICNLKSTDIGLYQYVHGAYYMINFVLVLFLLIDKRQRDYDKGRKRVYAVTIFFLVLLNIWIIAYEFTSKSMQQFLDRVNSDLWSTISIAVIVVSLILILLGYDRKIK